jgi:hypothetical protein
MARSLVPRPNALVDPALSTPPVLVADSSEADRIATKTADDVAVDAYNQHVVDFSEALSSYRDAQQWCDEDAHDAAVLTTSILPQFPLSSWPLLELLRCFFCESNSSFITTY